jgi:archaemetzincin
VDDSNIIFITHGQFEQHILKALASDVIDELSHPVILRENHLDLSDFYDQSRRQYDGNRLLKQIDSLTIPGTAKKIGLYHVDLFIPILTFIFGQAVFRGNSGIVSLYRLKNEQYGMKPDQDVLKDRFRKVIIHELGHTFGLIHCHIPNCVMRSSTYVEDIDQKSFHFCNKCREELNKGTT